MKRNMVTRPLTDEKGAVLIVGLLLIAVLAILGITALTNSSTDQKISGNYTNSERAFYAAEAGAEHGYSQLRIALEKMNPDVTTITPPTNIAGYTISGATFVQLNGTRSTGQTLTTGSYAGLKGFVQKYTITSTATSNTNNTKATLVYDVQDELIPLFQFGIFYNGNLEMCPGANMTFSGGRIHSNTNIYLQTTATLTINTSVTSAGKIYNKRNDSPYTVTGNNTVMIKDANSGTTKGLNFGNDDANWATKATSTWGGAVQSADHGISALNLPLSSTSSDPYDIIGVTDSNSLYKKSGLTIVNGVAKDKNGSTVTLASGTISTSTFTDQREGKVMTVTNVDIAKLTNSTLNAAAVNALNDPPTGGDAGIVYVSTNATNGAVRLVNGGTLPSTGLSVATDDPLYIKGDYNTANNPAAVYSDAVTVLSGSWSDSNSTSGISSRTAAATTVNAALMTGNVPTATNGTNYSGGVENFIRFLENWSGKTFTYGGSLTCLWSSQKANAKWPSTGTVYNPPTRNWSYNIDVNNLPPGTPRVRNMSRNSWHQVNN